MNASRHARYLKLIALFKIGKGLLLLAGGVSLLVLNARTGWFDSIGEWIDDELLLEHSKPVKLLLNAVQDWLAGGHLRATGLLALFYSAVLFTEGIGVYFEQRWAEFLMIVATASLIPLEIRHVIHHQTVAGFTILVANCAIVLFLYRVLNREETKPAAAPAEPETADVR